jgi:hypothetical protein
VSLEPAAMHTRILDSLVGLGGCEGRGAWIPNMRTLLLAPLLLSSALHSARATLSRMDGEEPSARRRSQRRRRHRRSSRHTVAPSGDEEARLAAETARAKRTVVS